MDQFVTRKTTPRNNFLTFAVLQLRWILVGPKLGIVFFFCSDFSSSKYLLLSFQYQFANFSDSNYSKTGKASLKLQLINQRADFSFALFRGGLSNVGGVTNLGVDLFLIILN